MRTAVLCRTVLAVLAASTFPLTACDRAPGSFSLTFTWDEPPTTPVWIWARVEERLADPTVAGPILASAGPERFVFGGQVDLNMASVPNGDDRVVVVEVREGESVGLPILWYGLSEPFSLKAGDDQVVEVALKLKRPEAEALEATVALQWDGQARSVVRPAELATASVVTRSTGAQAVMLANDASFSAGLRTVTLVTGEGVTRTDEADDDVTWTTCTVAAWDLGAGLPTAGEDGQYTLFAKFVDSYGYESSVKKATVQADGTAPIVLSAALSRALAKPGDTVVLTVTAHEALGEGDLAPTLTWNPPDALGFGEAERVGTTSTYQWTTMLPQLADGAAYGFTVRLTDSLGNASESTTLYADQAKTQALALTIDATTPALVDDVILLEKDGVTSAEGDSVIFGLPPEGVETSGTLSLAFALREKNPGSSLPTVRLAGVVVGSVSPEPTLDDASADAKGFSFTYAVQQADWGSIEADIDLEVTLEDAAGNRAALSLTGLANRLRFDFVRPTAAQCLVDPADSVARATDTLTYVVVASEPLAEEPELALAGNVEPMFEDAAEVSAGDRRYAWAQAVEDLETEELDVSAALVDRAGNTSDGPVCSAHAWLDGLPPRIDSVTVWTDPEVRDAHGAVVRAVGPGDVLVVEVIFTEAQAMFPDFVTVKIAGFIERVLEPETFAEFDDGTWGWNGRFVVDAATDTVLEGQRAIAVTVEDAAGNPQRLEEPEVPFVIDLTPPGAECLLNRDAVRPGERLRVTVTPTEAVLPADVVLTTSGGLALEADAGESQPLASPQKLVWAATPTGSVDWSYEVRVTDLVGNAGAGPACSGQGIVDGVAPELVEGVGQAPAPTVFGLEDAADPGKNRLTFSFALREPHAPTLPASGVCAESAGCPRVTVGERTPGALTRRSDLDDVAAGTWGFAYEADLVSSEWGAVEQEPTITLFWQDVLGNALATDFGTVKLDFVRPELQVTVEPADRPARLGETVTVTAQNVKGDALDAASLTLGSIPALDGAAGPTGTGALYRWTYVTKATDDGLHAFTVSGHDLAGNPAEEVGTTASLDGKAPAIQLTQDLSETRAPDTVATFTFEVAFTLDDPALTGAAVAVELRNDAGFAEAMEPMEASGAGGFAYALTVDATAIPSQLQSPFFSAAISATDRAGNSAQQLTATIQLDVVPPELASLDVTPFDVAPGGALRAVLTADKRLSAIPALMAAAPGQPTLAFVADANQAPGQLRYTYLLTWPNPLPAANVVAVYTVEPTLLSDVAGNVRSDAVAPVPAAFRVDGMKPLVATPTLEGGKDVRYSAQPAYKYLTVSFEVNDPGEVAAPTVFASLETVLGTRLLECASAVGVYDCPYEFKGDEGQGAHLLTLTARDAAGNQATEFAAVSSDFQPPRLISAACSPPLSKLGQTTTCVATLDEVPTNADDRHLRAKSVTGLVVDFGSPSKASSDGRSLTWEHETDRLESGSFQTEIDAPCDDLDNCAGWPTVLNAPFESDADVPRIVSATVVGDAYDGDRVLNDVFSAEAGFNDLVVYVEGTDDNGEWSASATIGRGIRRVPLVCDLVFGDVWQCRLTVQASDDVSDGLQALSLVLRDAAGNEDSTDLDVMYDFSPPAVVSSVAAPDPAKLGTVLRYSVTLTEPMDPSAVGAEGPILAAEDATSKVIDLGTPTLVSADGLNLWWEAPVEDGDDGDYSGRIERVCDLFANCVDDLVDGLSGFRIDATAPILSTAVPVTYPKAAYGIEDPQDLAANAFVFDFAFEDLDPPADMPQSAGPCLTGCPEVLIGGKSVGVVSRRFDLDDPSRYRYGFHFDYRVRMEDFGPLEATETVTVRWSDAAGNRTAIELPDIALDFIRPHVIQDSIVTQLIPDFPATNPLYAVSAARNGTTIRVTFTTNEDVAPPPKVIAFKDDTYSTYRSIDLAIEAAHDNLFTYNVAIDGIASNVEYVNYLVIEPTQLPADAAGNAMELPIELSSFITDTAPPEPPNVLADGKVVYNRFSYGTEETQGERRFTVTGHSGALPSDAVKVFVYDGNTTDAGYIIGSAIAGSDGGFEDVLVSGADRPYVYLASCDAAGNLSAPIDVKNVRWIASMAGKGESSTFYNPHVFEVRRWMTDRRSQDDADVPTDISGLARIGGGGVAVTGDGSWKLHQINSSHPSHRQRHAMVYDAARGVSVLVGGYFNVVYNETWEWDGVYWLKRTPLDHDGDGNPSERIGTVMSYDSRRKRVVLFGGGGGTILGDTWEWDGVDWTRRLPTDPEADGDPPARDVAAMVYDSKRDRTVLFGGTDASRHNLGDTWEWNGASWEERIPEDPEIDGNPSPRFFHVMAYDEERDVTVMFSGNVSSETWEWDGTSWERKDPKDPEGDGNPTSTTATGCVYDRARGRVVLANELDDDAGGVWEWDGVSWALRGASDPELDGNPTSRGLHAVSYDSARARLVLFGGTGSDGTMDETWEWDDTSWRKKGSLDPTADPSPPPRVDHSLGYDSTAKKVLIYGGTTGLSEDGYFGDLWEWDGATWTEKVPLDPEGDGDPGPRSAHSAVYDEKRGVYVLFGGRCGNPEDDLLCGDTWEWNGASWHDVAVADAELDGEPAASAGHSIAYDEAREVSVLIGGETSVPNRDTWEWDGFSWILKTPLCASWQCSDSDGFPCIRSSSAAFYDNTNRVVLMYGGHGCSAAGGWHCGMLGDTWQWDGANWTQPEILDVEEDGAPGPRNGHGMAYDSDRGRGLLFGGASNQLLGDTWEWDGLGWARRTPADPEVDGTPSARLGSTIAYDGARNELVMFGGYNDLGAKNETWTWRWGEEASPGAVLHTAFSAAYAEEDVSVSEVSTRWIAGGSGKPQGVDVSGCVLLVWDVNAWSEVAWNTSAPDEPDALEWGSTDTGQIKRLFTGEEKDLTFAVKSRVPNGLSYGEVAVDYVDVTVVYRRP